MKVTLCRIVHASAVRLLTAARLSRQSMTRCIVAATCVGVNVACSSHRRSTDISVEEAVGYPRHGLPGEEVLEFSADRSARDDLDSRGGIDDDRGGHTSSSA